MDIKPYLYHYSAVITEVYDGDTVTADIDLGFGLWMRGQKLRLHGINAPELRGAEREAGLKSRDFLRGLSYKVPTDPWNPTGATQSKESLKRTARRQQRPRNWNRTPGVRGQPIRFSNHPLSASRVVSWAWG